MKFLEKPLERQSLTSLIEERLGRAIVTGELSAGEKLTEPELAVRLGVSRAPIREALIGLEFAGLVQTDERGRSVVPVMTHDDIHELYQLRRALEPLAAQAAAERMTPEIRARLRDNVQRTLNAQSNAELAALDTEFHDLIFEASGMPRLRQLWQCIRYQIELWLNQMLPQFVVHCEESQINARTARAHSEIIEILIQGDGEAAAERTKKHLKSWLPLVSSVEQPKE